MNQSIHKLYDTASKKSKYIIGLMSGTSLDGLDIALCKIDASGRDTKLKLLKFKTVSYPDKIVQKLQNLVSVESVLSRELTILHTFLGDYFGELILETLDEWHINPKTIDAIASHGQTIYHAPISYHQQKNMPNATLQMADGDHIARKTGILTISDFRQKHTAAGGEGAPMASLADELLFRDKTENRILLNIGGIANFVYLPADPNAKVITTDTGPGNTLINKATQRLFNKLYDENGVIAAEGKVRDELLEQFLSHSFLSESIPKSTGPEMFSMEWVDQCVKVSGDGKISNKDLIATLTRFSAQTITDAISTICEAENTAIYVSGGGLYNKTLITWIEDLIGRDVYSFEKIGFNPDAKEAACFAVLANEMLSGKPFVVNDQKGNFGKISFPL